MTALTANRYTKHRDGVISAHPVEADAHIFKGSLVCAGADGYAAPGSDSADTTFLGVAIEEADNTGGASGDISVRVQALGVFSFAATAGVTQADLGAAVCIKDDQTVGLAADTTNDVPCGRIEGLDGASVWVRIKV
jgi:hypothetical protein